MKNYTFYLVKSLLLFSAIVLLSFSCEDHTVPEILPVLKTERILQSGDPNSPAVDKYVNHYKLIIEQTGNVPVSKYGVVFTTYSRNLPSDNNDRNPTVVNPSNPPHVFTQEFGKGERSLDQSRNYGLRTFVYQRAYAILQDGRIIYGDVVYTIAGDVMPL